MNPYIRWNHGFVSHAIAQYEEEHLLNLKSMERYRGVIEDADYRSTSPTFKERVILSDQTYLEWIT
jgi:hypothetical protein